MTKRLVVWGATGQAIVLAEFVEQLGYKIVALFDQNVMATPINGLHVRPPSEFARWAAEQVGELFGVVAIGGDHGGARKLVAGLFTGMGIKLATLVHPSAYVARDALLGDGVQVLAGAVVGSRATVCIGAIVNTRASVDHECDVGMYAHIGPGATLAGCVNVGEGAFIGAGATVLPRVTIGEYATIGAGATVLIDAPPNTVTITSSTQLLRYK